MVLRELPSVDRLVRAADPLGEYPHAVAVRHARRLLEEVRGEVRRGGPVPDPEALAARLRARLEELFRPHLVGAINATGVVLHTNLGRAPLSARALARLQAVAAGYSNLEFDLEAGRRGHRTVHVRRLLTELTGAEDALVVNNNAAAVTLALRALCAGRRVLVSRGEAVEIGGRFRIPEVLAQSGAHLVEVGTTNRTYADDYRAAADEETAAILRVHRSNFRLEGFVHSPSRSELRRVADEHGLLFLEDLGSGSLLETTSLGLPPEPTVQEALAGGADLVFFSGDKLLGGPQAGLIVGRRDLVEALRRHPLTRALRVDKLTLAALEGTLLSYLEGKALEEIPIWRMLSTPPEALRRRARRWLRWVRKVGGKGEVRPCASAVGGGALPGADLPSFALVLLHPRPEGVAWRLRLQSPPVVARLEGEALWFDPRTVLPEQEKAFRAALEGAIRATFLEEADG